MKNKSQNNSRASQSSRVTKASQKHDVNLQKNSVLYFQIGLILCLLGTFSLFEMNFQTNHWIVQNGPQRDIELREFTMTDVKVFTEKKEVPQKHLKNLPTETKERPNDEPDPESFLEPMDEPSPKTPVKIEDLPPVINEPTDVHVRDVQFAPIFPGCETYKLNSKRVKCLNDKLGRLVQKKFNTDVASEYNLSGIQRIFIEFKVDKTGAITDIKTRAPHPKLEAEALKLAQKIPKMQPGKMGTVPVNVIYNLPITFKVQN